ncbi:MAG: ChaN family lipoprotein [Burkholderiaceae bacterium]
MRPASMIIRRRRSFLPGRRLLLALGGLLAIGGCAVPASPSDPSSAALEADYILLGEVHDNAEGHARRLDWLRAMPNGPRRAIVFEQFDLGHQAAIDRWREMRPDERGPAAAKNLAQAGGFEFRGWRFESYGPVIELALERGWDIRAGNLPRTEAMRIARDPAAAAPPPPGWPAAADAALESAVRKGHCGLVPEERVEAMALAQRSRDAGMAQAMRAARDDGAAQVLLIAGNGHVRRDYGVPAHLRGAQPDARIFALGFIESGNGGGRNRFDAVRMVPPADRPDPCAQLREHFGGRK